MEVLGIIPARGGSKGIPGKNIKPLAGKPLIAWTIEAAKHSKLLTRVIVSTDDEEIAATAKKYGAEVPFLRPKELAGDTSHDIEFLTHALDFLKEKESYVPDIVLRLPPTSPLRLAEDIDKGVQTLLDDPKADAVRPIIEAPKHPFKTWKISSDGKYLEAFFPASVTGFAEPHNMSRQLLPEAYIHTGAMDVMRIDTILKQRSTAGKRTAFFFMPEERSINIDHPLDFEVAEFLLKKRFA